MNATLNPDVLRWARERAGMDEATLAQKLGLDDVGAISEWETSGTIAFSRLEKLSATTHTPIGFLFLPQRPKETLPIKDFRRIGSGPIPSVTPELLDVIYAAQRRQEWYRDFLKENGEEPLKYVGSISAAMEETEAAQKITSWFNIGKQLSFTADTWMKNLTLHIDSIEDGGVLIMRSGVVGNSNKRSLSVDDFRGFALADEYAPVIFINSKDSIAAQIFTLIHELVHIFINESAVSNLSKTYSATNEIEKFCNAVAAEILVPKADVVRMWNRSGDFVYEIRRISNQYKVSTLVAARRAHDAGFITHKQFNDFFTEESARYSRRRTQDGGNFYNSLNARAGRKFIASVVSHTLEGKTLYTEAMRLIGVKNSKVFNTLAKELGYST